MRFPGFTAEAALVKTDDPYRLVETWAGSGGQAVIPQTVQCWPLPFLGGCVCCDLPSGGCWYNPGPC